MTMVANYFTVGPSLDVHYDDGVYWATCPGCPGFSAAADTWDELFALVRDFHASGEADHEGWLMIEPYGIAAGGGLTRTAAEL